VVDSALTAQTLSARQLNERIRAAVLEATTLEAKKAPFRLSGRGHEPRVTLDRSLAAVLRSIDVPHVVISGYGPNKHYPARIFTLSAELLARRLGASPLVVSSGQVWRKSVAGRS
jgi:hypothetical protein